MHHEDLYQNLLVPFRMGETLAAICTLWYHEKPRINDEMSTIGMEDDNRKDVVGADQNETTTHAAIHLFSTLLTRLKACLCSSLLPVKASAALWMVCLLSTLHVPWPHAHTKDGTAATITRYRKYIDRSMDICRSIAEI
jgi:hypothetical protein